MKPVNVRLRDNELARAINVLRFANSEVRAALQLLAKADETLFVRMIVALEKMPANSFKVKRLDTLLSGVWEANEAAYRQLATRAGEQMLELTVNELQAQRKIFSDLLPEGQARIGLPGSQNVFSAANAKPFRGRLMSDWFSTLGASRQRRVEESLRGAFVRGETVDEMVRALRGTRAQNYKDGIINTDRRHVEAVVRTATSHYAAEARGAFYEQNSDLIKAEQWVSTLDTRTTETCQVRDGLLYTADRKHDPIEHEVPWEEGPGEIHWQCRSISVPVLNSAELLGFELPPVERAAMNGVAAPKTTFREWIQEQPAAVQNKALGPVRAKMLREGASFDRFFAADGSFLTLQQLKEEV